MSSSSSSGGSRRSGRSSSQAWVLDLLGALLIAGQLAGDAQKPAMLRLEHGVEALH
jgi:hypothetical protein